MIDELLQPLDIFISIYQVKMIGRSKKYARQL